VLGAAWARVVDPVLVRDETGRAVPEVIIAVAEECRGTGLGRRLMEALMRHAAERHTGLALTVSERNRVALELYERLGFQRVDRAPSGLLAMAWRASPDQ
jgi:ribosomal protein S18 acetylase RimI-like enzyme